MWLNEGDFCTLHCSSPALLNQEPTMSHISWQIIAIIWICILCCRIYLRAFQKSSFDLTSPQLSSEIVAKAYQANMIDHVSAQDITKQCDHRTCSRTPLWDRVLGICHAIFLFTQMETLSKGFVIRGSKLFCFSTIVLTCDAMGKWYCAVFKDYR